MTLIQANIDATASAVWPRRQGTAETAAADDADGGLGEVVVARNNSAVDSSRRPMKQIIIAKEALRIPLSTGSRKRAGHFFAEWSPWSSCDDGQCRQQRERVCRVPRKCADKKLVEERRCSSSNNM